VGGAGNRFYARTTPPEIPIGATHRKKEGAFLGGKKKTTATISCKEKVGSEASTEKATHNWWNLFMKKRSKNLMLQGKCDAKSSPVTCGFL